MPVLFCSDVFWHERGEELTAIDPAIEVVQLVGDELVSDADLERITIAFFSNDAWPERAAPFFKVALSTTNLQWFHSMSALSLIHISEPTRLGMLSRMPSSA